jgi:hypothetical protein
MFKRGLGLLALLIVWLASSSSAFAVTLTLGNAASFVALSTTKSVSLSKNASVGAGFVGGQSVTLGTSSSAGSDVVAIPKGITVGKDASVAGSCVTDGAKIVIKSGASCGAQSTDGTNPDLTTMTAAIADLGTFETNLAGMAATQPDLGKLSVAKNGFLAIADTINGGLNILTGSSITLKPGATLQLTGIGGAGEMLVLNLSGKLSMAASAQIALSGLTASQVIINVSATSVTLPKASNFPATLIAPNGACTLGADSGLTGAMLCEKKVTVGLNSGISFVPFGPTVTPPTAWVVTGSLNIGRSGHTQTTLADGRVLVAGGISSLGVEASAELYDATGAVATLTGVMTTGRFGHTATLLQNGTVLVAGGENASGTTLASAELYDPVTGLFTPTGSLGIARAFHTATLLASGKVLIAGGDTLSTPIKETELYDPIAGTFGGVSSMNVARDNFVTGLFVGGPLDGKVIVAGGNVSSPLTSAELYDPTSNSFATTGSMMFERARGVGAMLNTGKFLVAGGGLAADDDGATSELFDPVSLTFSQTALASGLTAAHVTGTATVLPDGLVALVGGTILPSGDITDITNIYDPNTGEYLPLFRMNHPREVAAASLLSNGQVLATGGDTDLGLNSTSAELLH